jgi:glycosyltransferase involved in cell wall biosynthesis
MKIAVVSSFVPFINGGGRFIVDWLHEKLLEAGHQSEKIYLPFVDSPEFMLDQVTAYRLIDLNNSADRIICIRPPAYILPHENKVVWFIHHFRAFYDLWDSPYRGLPDRLSSEALRSSIFGMDGRALNEARRVYTNSDVVGDRLRRFNGVKSTTLYPPLLKFDHFRADKIGDEIVCICRIEPHKRQHLLVEAMAHVRSGVRLRICGASEGRGYVERLREIVKHLNLESRVTIINEWISEEAKVAFLSNALAAAYVPLDEDGYGYPTLEAAYSSKAVISTTDSGAVRELVVNYLNGLIVEPEPRAIAAAMDRLFEERHLAESLGTAARVRLTDLRIDWDHVVSSLTA